MKKVNIFLPLSIFLTCLVLLITYFNTTKNHISETDKNHISESNKKFVSLKKEKKKKKSIKQQRRFTEERWKHEFDLQVNPKTGKIPEKEKEKEIIMSTDMMIKRKNSKASNNTSYISRGPSNLGGRTRSLVIDRSDATANTIISGGVSSGVFRTTDGGASWLKVSPNNEIHNVTTIAQDPRSGFQNIWYYGTGEAIGNSASAGGAAFLGQGIWQSTDSGQNWTQVPITASIQEEFDSPFDIVFKIVVHPITGDLYAATADGIRRFDGSVWTLELDAGGVFFSDLAITITGIVYVAFSGNSETTNGVWQSPTGIGSYTRIGSNTDPGFGSTGRMVLALAPSNENTLYAFHTAGGAIEAGLWQWNNIDRTWTDRTSTMPDEPDPDPSNPDTIADLQGNDPIAVQGGYNLVINVKPDDENFVVIGATNAYRIEDITTDSTFVRIGGYRNNQSFASYDLGVNGDVHHPDIHVLEFDINNPNILYSGSDGGIHRTNDATINTVAWTNLNNNYQTYQYYHVATDPAANSNIVIGGAQDNGTTAGGFETSPDLTTMSSIIGGDGVAVAVSRDNACVPFFVGVQNGPIFRDCPNPGEITPEGSDSQFVTYFYLDETNNNALYYAGENLLFRTTESSEVTTSSWTNLGSLPQQEDIRQMAATRNIYDRSESYLLIGGNQGSLFRLDDPQNVANLSPIRDISPTDENVGTVSGIAIHPTNNDIVMVTYSNYGLINIFITTNATDNDPTWTEVERNLSEFSIRSAAITLAGNDTIYFVGTARGLYSSTDPENIDWEIEAPDQIGFAVVSALAYKTSNNKLLVGTHGNGMYEGTLESVIIPVEPEPEILEDTLIAWPIPAENELNIIIGNAFEEDQFSYELFNISGQRVLNGILDENREIDVGSLSQGNYILVLESPSAEKSILINKR